jgi:peptidyl-prolyl cis-trans isomerase A (cyclophilin A)
MSAVLVVIETELGDIEVSIDAARAPGTAANFLRYVDAGYYTGGRFHRTVTPDNQPNDQVRIEVIQAGIDPEHDPQKFPAIAMERTNVTGLHHTDGAISMARREVDSAQSDFFICLGDQPELDFGGRRNPDGQGFAAFGLVTAGGSSSPSGRASARDSGEAAAAEGIDSRTAVGTPGSRVPAGMDVVRKIQRAPRDAQRLTPPVRILGIRRAARESPAAPQSTP